MEHISTISIKLCIRRMRYSKDKASCFKSLDNTFIDIPQKSGIFTQISENIINYIETTNNNAEKLNSQKIAWVKEWAQIKTEERLPPVGLSLRETIQRFITKNQQTSEIIKDGIIYISKKTDLPESLNTEEAKTYFNKAIEKKLMDENYRWMKGLQLLSCFAQEMSDALNMGKGVNSDGSKRISWMPFEELFNIEKGKLKSNFADIKKSGCYPSDIECIKSIFK